MPLQCRKSALGAFFAGLLCNFILSSGERHGAPSQLKLEKLNLSHGKDNFMKPHTIKQDGIGVHLFDFLGIGQTPHAGENLALGKVKPISTTLWCIISITVQYLFVYTCLALVRLWCDFSELECSKLLKTFRMASYTVNYGPALCVLLLGCRMRVNWLTQGRGDMPLFVGVCMYACTIAIILNTLLVLIFPIFVEEGLSVCKRTGDPHPPTHPHHGVEHWGVKIALQIARYLFLSVLYGGVSGIVFGMITYVPPEDMRPDPIPPVSPAVACTMNLSMQFFLVYFFVAVARTLSEIKGEKTRFEEVMVDATNTVNMAPMLCILFLGARMRALSIDPVHGHPQWWAQSCFYMCAYAILTQTLMAVAIPIVLRGDVQCDKYGVHDTRFQIHGSHQCIGISLDIARYVITICIYAGFISVIISIFTHHRQGEPYKPVTSTLLCVVNLAIQFFLIYFMLWTLLVMRDTGYEVPRVFQAVEAARTTVMFAPIISILFVAMKMRALSLSNNQRYPPTWAVIAMYVATWSVALQFVICLAMALFGEVALSHDGHITHRSMASSAHITQRSVASMASSTSASSETVNNALPDSSVGKGLIIALRLLTMLLFYGGVITVVVAIVIMTPEMTVGEELSIFW